MAKRDALAEARAALATIETELSALKAQREAFLLTTNDGALDRLENQIATLRRHAERAADRIHLLEDAAQGQAAERRAKEQRGVIERVERKLNESNEAAAELQNFVALAEKAFRKIIALRSECAAEYPFSTNDQVALAFTAQTIHALLTHELARVGSKPFVGGADGAMVQVSFPGARAPDHALAAQPEAIKPLVDAIREASEFASRLMRGGVIAPAVEEHQALAEAT
jgi:hypothetical protein